MLRDGVDDYAKITFHPISVPTLNDLLDKNSVSS
jgi:hypothetical protein